MLKRAFDVLLSGTGLVFSSPLWLLFFFPGAIAYFIIWLWYLYRCVLGWMRFNSQRPPVLTPAD